MRMLVLGAGLQGSACAFDLLQQPVVERVTLADLHPNRLPPFLTRVKSRRLKLRTLNAKSAAAVRAIERLSSPKLGQNALKKNLT